MDCKQDCENYRPKPAPVSEKSAEQRLELAGAKVNVHAIYSDPDRKYHVAELWGDGIIDLQLSRLPLPRAEAALLAATDGIVCDVCDIAHRLENREAGYKSELSAAQAEVERLKGEIAEANRIMLPFSKTAANSDWTHLLGAWLARKRI